MALFRSYIPQARPSPRSSTRSSASTINRKYGRTTRKTSGSAMTDYYKRQQESRKNARSMAARRAAADRYTKEQQAKSMMTNSYLTMQNQRAAQVKRPTNPYLVFQNQRAAQAKVSPKTTTGGVGSGGGYGGNGGGGGGYGGGASSTTGGGGSSGTTAPSGPSKNKSVDSARDQQLKDALAAVAAQYGMEEANLLADLAGIGNQWRTLNYDINEGETEARRANVENMVRRGIYHSSTRATEENKLIKAAADQRTKVLQEYGTKEAGGAAGTQARKIDSALKLLKQQKTAATKQAESQSAAGQLDLESLLALIGLGVEGTSLGA